MLRVTKRVIRNANHITLDIKDHLSFLTQHGFKINLIWTPGHKGIIGNEIADHLANGAALSGHRPKFKIPFQDFFYGLQAIPH